MASEIRSFRDLVVWQEAMTLVVEAYKLTEKFPATERYGLTSQIRRSCCSIPSNVAEGHNRKSTRTYLHHVRIALGSEAEFETQIELALRLGYCTKDDVQQILARRAAVGKMLHALSRSLKRRLRFEVTAALTASCVVLGCGWWCVSAALLQWL
jgi:four helix bundle protein